MFWQSDHDKKDEIIHRAHTALEIERNSRAVWTCA